MRGQLRAKSRLFFLLVIISFIPMTYQIITLPKQLRLVVGEEQEICIRQPLAAFLAAEDPITGNHQRSDGWQQVTQVRPTRVGKSRLQVRLFGLIPIREINVEVIPQLRVSVGGQAVGILISSHGVLITRILPVDTEEGRKYPAKEAGLEPGDVILSIDSQPIYQVEQVGKWWRQLEKAAGKPGWRSSEKAKSRSSTLSQLYRRQVST